MTFALTADDLVFDRATHRSTRPDGREVPHVTAVLSAVGVSTNFEDLAQLSKKLAADIAARCVLGSIVHLDAHAYDDEDLDWSSVSDQSRPFVEAWATCRANNRLKPLLRERRIYHPLYDYTGFYDGVFLHEPSGKIVLGDLKLGDPDDSGCMFQTAAYAEAHEAARPDMRIDERWAIQLTPERRVPYRITNYSDYQTRPNGWLDFQQFLAFLTTFRAQAGRRERYA